MVCGLGAEVAQLDQAPAGDPAGLVLVGLAHVDELDLPLGQELGDLLRGVVIAHVLRD